MEEMKILHEVCDDLMQQITEAKRLIPKNRLMEPHEAAHLDSLLHSMKSLKTIIAMEEHAGEEEGAYKAARGMRYQDGGRGESYRDDGTGASNAYGARQRDSRGRFRDGGESYGMYVDPMGRPYYRDGNNQVKEHLQRAMETAQNQEERRVLEDAMKRLGNI